MLSGLGGNVNGSRPLSVGLGMRARRAQHSVSHHRAGPSRSLKPHNFGPQMDRRAVFGHTWTLRGPRVATRRRGITIALTRAVDLALSSVAVYDDIDVPYRDGPRGSVTRGERCARTLRDWTCNSVVGVYLK